MKVSKLVLILVASWIAIWVLVLFLYFGSGNVLLFETVSPGGTHKLQVIQKNGGATVDFSIVVYLNKGLFRKKIYNAYHESDATVKWIDEDIVEINGRVLNVNSDVYDWRNGHSISSLLQNSPSS